jgi:hypothetical protein
MDPLAVPERIARDGDWHANPGWGVRAIRYAKEQGADVILHLGDFGYDFNERLLTQLTEQLETCQVPLLFVDGNHENFDVLLQYPVEDNGLRKLTDWIWHIPRGFRWEWDTVRFIGLGGAHSIDRKYRTAGVSWWWQERLTEADIEFAISGGTADVMISHDCPMGVRIPGIAETAHQWDPDELHRSRDHQRRVLLVVDEVRPRFIWHGHFHKYYRQVADLGYGAMRVTGLDCDGSTQAQNIDVVALSTLKATLGEARNSNVWA